MVCNNEGIQSLPLKFGKIKCPIKGSYSKGYCKTIDGIPVEIRIDIRYMGESTIELILHEAAHQIDSHNRQKSSHGLIFQKIYKRLVDTYNKKKVNENINESINIEIKKIKQLENYRKTIKENQIKKYEHKIESGLIVFYDFYQNIIKEYPKPTFEYKNLSADNYSNMSLENKNILHKYLEGSKIILKKRQEIKTKLNHIIRRMTEKGFVNYVSEKALDIIYEDLKQKVSFEIYEKMKENRIIHIFSYVDYLKLLKARKLLYAELAWEHAYPVDDMIEDFLQNQNLKNLSNDQQVNIITFYEHSQLPKNDRGDVKYKYHDKITGILIPIISCDLKLLHWFL
jgi:hypothetical protein